MTYIRHINDIQPTYFHQILLNKGASEFDIEDSQFFRPVVTLKFSREF